MDQGALTAPGSGAAHGVDTLDEVSITKQVKYTRGHTCHDAHAQQHIVGVSQLDAVLAERGAKGPHAERQHVHHATCMRRISFTYTPYL